MNDGRTASEDIDVYETEPPISSFHPLLNAKNEVLTPHVALVAREALERRAEIAFNNVISWINDIEKTFLYNTNPCFDKAWVYLSSSPSYPRSALYKIISNDY
ncbi:MAG: hypothetical protein GX854_04625 [Clostridiales bacterium]|nr:hypothetical protein [Clostridiales bacterium]